VNVPRLNPSQIGWYLIYLPRKDGRLSWRRRLVTYQNGLQAVTRHSTRCTVISLIEWNALSLRQTTYPLINIQN